MCNHEVNAFESLEFSLTDRKTEGGRFTLHTCAQATELPVQIVTPFARHRTTV